jgi:DNA repair protein RecO (recombination protein O)
MSTRKVRGVVLKETAAGESDKSITLLTKELGKISVSARGARKPGSKYLAGTQLFTYSDFVLFDGGRFFAVTQIDVIEQFYALRTEYEKLCCGMYFAELCDKMLPLGEACPEILYLLLKAFQALQGAQAPSAALLAARIFELKFLQACGYAPELTACAVCGEAGPGLTVGPGPMFGPGPAVGPGPTFGRAAGVFFGGEGLLCDFCGKKAHRAVRVSIETLEVMGYILNTPPRAVFRVGVSPGLAEPLQAATEIFIDAQVEPHVKSMEFVRALARG